MLINNIKVLWEKLKRDKSNQIIIVSKYGKKKITSKIEGLKVIFNGKNNKVILHEPLPKFVSTAFYMNGNYSEIVIGASEYSIKHSSFVSYYNSKIEIGDNFFAGGMIVYMPYISEENLYLKIGNNCKFSDKVQIRLTDSHTIIDLNTGEAINQDAKIVIGNHVWCGSGCCLLKGAEINDDSIVGAMSLVNKKFAEKNILIAGVPAHKIKENITWDIRSYSDYMTNKHNGDAE